MKKMILIAAFVLALPAYAQDLASSFVVQDSSAATVGLPREIEINSIELNRQNVFAPLEARILFREVANDVEPESILVSVKLLSSNKSKEQFKVSALLNEKEMNTGKGSFMSRLFVEFTVDKQGKVLKVDRVYGGTQAMVSECDASFDAGTYAYQAKAK